MIAGTDEAGRGCLAGPIVAAAVILDLDRLIGPDASPLNDLDDSKRLTPAVRDRLAAAVLRCASSVCIRVASPSQIDKAGLHVTNLAVLTEALSGLAPGAELGLVDGFALSRPIGFETRKLIKGDQTSAAVAAAAIIAKTTRDKLMAQVDLATGQRWAFADHHGYATPLHHERIHLHGISTFHRLSFASTAYETAGHGGSSATHHGGTPDRELELSERLART
jgi:ribonuclease HII